MKQMTKAQHGKAKQKEKKVLRQPSMPAFDGQCQPLKNYLGICQGFAKNQKALRVKEEA